MNDHHEIIEMLKNFLFEHSTHWDEIPINNRWEAGMLKSMCLINDYYGGKENEEEV